jgi:hypothetical protein
MDLRDLVKLAGIVNPELLNKIETTAEVEEADAAGFDKATTRPDEEVMDDPMATMGSDADLSLRRYLKARGDHVTVDENVYPDYTVEDVNEAYASFKEGKYKSDAQRKAVHAAKAEESVDEAAMSDEEKERAMRRAMQAADEPERGEKKKKVSLKKAPWEESVDEASIGAPDYNPASGKYADNIVDRVVLGAEEGGIIVSVDGKPIGWAPTPEELADMLKSAGVDDNTDIMASSSVDFASEEEFENDNAAHEFIQNALEIMGIDESVAEADIDENAFNQAAAAAARAGKDSFEFGGKTHKTTMKKDVAHKLDDDVDMLRKLAGLSVMDEGKLKDQLIRDSETMSKEDFTKKYGKEVADEYFESVTEGKLKDQLIRDSETMSKEEFAKKYGKELADDMYESTESLDYVKKLAGL